MTTITKLTPPDQLAKGDRILWQGAEQTITATPKSSRWHPGFVIHTDKELNGFYLDPKTTPEIPVLL